MEEGTLFKILTVVGDAKNRDLGKNIHDSVAEFLESVAAEIVDLKISPDLTTSFGKAIVTVFYKESATLVAAKAKADAKAKVDEEEAVVAEAKVKAADARAKAEVAQAEAEAAESAANSGRKSKK